MVRRPSSPASPREPRAATSATRGATATPGRVRHVRAALSTWVYPAALLAVSFRLHWLELVGYRSLLYLPLAFFGFSPVAALVHAIFGTLIGHLNHANLDFGPRWWRWLLNSPRMHIWHHDHAASGRATRN